jgi:leucyl/phenylalanyl-tRNA---protein transferase
MGRANVSYLPTIEDVLAAYKLGYFPMAAGPNGAIEFYYFEPRGIIPLDDRFTVRKSLRQIINRGEHIIKFDTQFEGVIRSCARHEKPRHEVWLSNDMIEIYLELHRMGIAHSVEVWSAGDESKLVGGLYGLAMGSAFLGESMFSLAPNASQIALVSLVEHLRSHNFTLLDAQMSSDHLKQFGMIEMPQSEYLELLRDALSRNANF